MRTGAIYSENPAEHWEPYNTKGGVVLDLGCGFHDQDSRNKRYCTPAYFQEQGAKTIIGIDSNKDDIEMLREEVRGVFMAEHISGSRHLQRIVESLEVTHLKCDIEGGETALFDLEPLTIRDVAVEVHTAEIRQGFLHWLARHGFKVYADLYLNHVPHITVLFAAR